MAKIKLEKEKAYWNSFTKVTFKELTGEFYEYSTPTNNRIRVSEKENDANTIVGWVAVRSKEKPKPKEIPSEEK